LGALVKVHNHYLASYPADKGSSGQGQGRGQEGGQGKENGKEERFANLDATRAKKERKVAGRGWKTWGHRAFLRRSQGQAGQGIPFLLDAIEGEGTGKTAREDERASLLRVEEKEKGGLGQILKMVYDGEGKRN